MGKTTGISWTDSTFNPWEGCANCYAEARNHRWGNDNGGTGKPRRRTSTANWRLPVKWNREVNAAKFRQCSTCGWRGRSSDIEAHLLECPTGYTGSVPARPRVFCASLADWLDDEVPIEWLADLLALIAATPNLTWQMLTKRPENWRKRLLAVTELAGASLGSAIDGQRLAYSWLGGNAPANVWLGTTVEDQRRANERIPHALAIPAQVWFLSHEPALENVILPPEFLVLGQHGWCITGGESGAGARPFNIEWARAIIRQCKAAQVPVFVKQFGSHPHFHREVNGGTFGGPAYVTPDGTITHQHVDRKGGDMAEWPADLRVRQFPPPPDAGQEGVK